MGRLKAVDSGMLTPSQYTVIHAWVRKNLGTPNVCSKCSFTSDNKRQFDWSNNSGKYLKDLSDWERLCKKCHRRKDSGKPELSNDKCLRGHLLIGENLYIKPSRGERECRACKRIWKSVAWKKRQPNTGKGEV